MSSFFPMNMEVRHVRVLAPSLFNRITDLVFADNTVIFAGSLEVLAMTLEALHEETKP